MIAVASAWLGLSLLLCASAWLAGKRRAAIFLPFAAMIAALCLYAPLGRPIPFAPPAGNYLILGADIEEGVAIYALLKADNGRAVFYTLPFTNNKASAIQQALDDGGAPHMAVGQDGEGEVIAGEALPAKQADSAPAISIP